MIFPSQVGNFATGKDYPAVSVTCLRTVAHETRNRVGHALRRIEFGKWGVSRVLRGYSELSLPDTLTVYVVVRYGGHVVRFAAQMRTKVLSR